MQDTVNQLKRDIYNIVKLHKDGLDLHNQLKEIDGKLEKGMEVEDE